jgi:acylaminoacyl-peptidase
VPTLAAGYVATVAYLCSMGYAVVYCNYRGSTGYGERALQSLVGGAAGTQDVADCVAIAEAAVAEGVADPRRICVVGGSHGGFLVRAGRAGSFLLNVSIQDSIHHTFSVGLTVSCPVFVATFQLIINQRLRLPRYSEGAHLIGQAPDMFRCAVLRNPVTDIAAMVPLTDIPDWCYVVGLYKLNPVDP